MRRTNQSLRLQVKMMVLYIHPVKFQHHPTFARRHQSMIKSLCYAAGSLVIMGLLTSPLNAQPVQLDKKNSYKITQVKKGKKKKKAPQKIKMDVLKDGYR